jgi:hypothetical protein
VDRRHILASDKYREAFCVGLADRNPCLPAYKAGPERARPVRDDVEGPTTPQMEFCRTFPVLITAPEFAFNARLPGRFGWVIGGKCPRTFNPSQTLLLNSQHSEWPIHSGTTREAAEVGRKKSLHT